MNQSSGTMYFELLDTTVNLKVIVQNNMLEHFKTHQKATLTLFQTQNNILCIEVGFQTFTGELVFQTLFSDTGENDDSHRLLHKLTQISAFPVQLFSIEDELIMECKVMLSEENRIIIKNHLGELLFYEEGHNLKETIQNFPKGFAVPYTNNNQFNLLLKVDHSTFDFLSLGKTDLVLVESLLDTNLLALTVSFKELYLGSIRFNKSQICDDILEDFEILLETNQINLIIASNNDDTKQYLQLNRTLKREDVQHITRFLFSNADSLS